MVGLPVFPSTVVPRGIIPQGDEPPPPRRSVLDWLTDKRGIIERAGWFLLGAGVALLLT